MTPIWTTANVRLMCAAVGVAALTAAGSAGGHAQSTVPPTAPDQHQDQQHRARPAPRQPPGSTSETLGQGHGVLEPPQTGDSNVITPQNPSRAPTPNIAPPGTPGGNPNVVPK